MADRAFEIQDPLGSYDIITLNAPRFEGSQLSMPLENVIKMSKCLHSLGACNRLRKGAVSHPGQRNFSHSGSGRLYKPGVDSVLQTVKLSWTRDVINDPSK